VIARILTIAWNTGREAIRSKLLYTLLFFALLLILASLILANISYVERDRILQDIGFAAIRFFTSRGEFLLGKYLGLVVTLWLQAAIMVLAFAAVSLLRGAPLGPGHAAAFALLGVELAVVVAVATLFSAFTTPLLASLFTGGVWAVGNLTRSLRDLGVDAESGLVKHVTGLLHRTLPDLASFNLSVEAAHGLPIAASDVWLPLVYGFGYVALLLVCAVTIFERRDFK
jgi:ABC-type transport system involved in multi-copper enzyme maturation permease subunit